MKRLLLLLALYPAWLAMMAVHEFGHVLHARLSGGRVMRVELPLLGFSRTDVSPNPHLNFVAWGGPLWGSILPLILWLALRRTRVAGAAALFAGFCCVVNGAYLAVGWTMPDGDAGDLRRHGTPVWTMVVAGMALLSTGLYLWHRATTPISHAPPDTE